MFIAIYPRINSLGLEASSGTAFKDANFYSRINGLASAHKRSWCFLYIPVVNLYFLRASSIYQQQIVNIQSLCIRSAISDTQLTSAHLNGGDHGYT